MSKKKETKVEEKETKTTDSQVQEIPKPDISDATVALEETIMELIHYEPFFANLTLNMRREFTTKFPTLAVNVTEEVNLYINPYFFKSLSLPERVDVIKHECLHVINNHFVRFHDLEPQIYEMDKNRPRSERMRAQQTASVLNMAADYAINEYLPNLPKGDIHMFDEKGEVVKYPAGSIDPKTGKDYSGQPAGGKLLFVNDLKKDHPSVQNQQNFEYYYEFLKKEQEKNQNNGKQPQNGPGQGGMTLDDHSAWHESDATEDHITEKVKEVVNKAVEQTSAKDMGSVPGNIIQAIHDLNHVPKDWRQDIQRFVARTAEIVIESTRKKRNRRYGIVHPGYKILPKLHIAVGLDTSGSVGDEELQQFFSEMVRLHNMEINLTVIECDTKVNSVYKFDPNKEFTVHGRGGTAFKPVFDECNKLEVDGLIYFTDGECWGENIKKPSYTVLWALTPPFHTQYLPKWFNSGTKSSPHTKIEIRKKVRR